MVLKIDDDLSERSVLTGSNWNYSTMEGIGYSSPERTTLTKIYDLPNSRMLNLMVQSKFNLEVKIFW